MALHEAKEPISNGTDAGIQDYPLSEVPSGGRKSLASLSVVLLGFTFFTATMFGGGRLGPAFPFWPDLIGVLIVGNLLLGCYVAVLGWIACRSGLSSVLMGRFAFGNMGSRWPDLLLGCTQVGWYGWGTATVAVVFLKLMGKTPEENTLLLNAAMVFFGFAFCWTAWVGYRGLEWLSLVAVPLMTALILWSFTIALGKAGGLQGLLSIQPTDSMPLGAAITIVFGTFVSGGTQSTNWTRFAATPAQAVGSSLIAFFLGNGLMIFAGAFGALVYQQADIVEVLVLQGLLVSGIVMLFLNIWTTQDNTIYNFSVAGCNFLRHGDRRLFTIGGAAIGTVLGILRIDLHLVPFLLALGTFIPPVGGVIMANYLFHYRSHYPRLTETSLPAWHWPGIIAYISGSAAAWYTPGVPPLNGIIAAILVYWICDRLTGRGHHV